MNEKESIIQRPSKEELFTDRQEFLDAFEGALTDLTPDAPKVLVFHGSGVIEKYSQLLAPYFTWYKILL